MLRGYSTGPKAAPVRVCRRGQGALGALNQKAGCSEQGIYINRQAAERGRGASRQRGETWKMKFRGGGKHAGAYSFAITKWQLNNSKYSMETTLCRYYGG